LLSAGFERSCALGFSTHPLHGIHHVRLLSKESVPEIGGPLDVPRESLDHIGKGDHGLHACVPRLFRHGISKRFIFQIFVPLHPLLELDHFQGIG
jgi:hypothetical protein